MSEPQSNYNTKAEVSYGESLRLPSSKEAEEAVIGAILISEPVFSEVSIVLRDGAVEFYYIRLRYIWEAVCRLVDRQAPIDPLTVAEELDDMGRLEDVGGQGYLAALLNQAPSVLNAWSYAKNVHNDYIRRLLIKAANTIAEVALDTTLDIDEVIAKAASATNPALMANKPDSMVKIGVALKETDAKIERNRRAGVPPGIPTGFVDIDAKLGGGAQPGEVLLIAARPGSGKTSLLLQIADYAARIEKRNVVIFSLEMSRDRLTERWISQATGIDGQLLHAGMIPDMQLQAYNDALETIDGLPVTIDDDPILTPSMLRAKLEMLYNLGELDLVLIDYLALMEPEMRYGSPAERINDFARTLKQFARRFDVPIWVLQQMNRNIEKKDQNAFPTLSDLSDGGEKDPDVVAFLHHRRDDDGRIIASYFCIPKARNGPTAIIPLGWNGATTKFASYVSTKKIPVEA